MRRGTILLILALVVVLIGAGWWAFSALSAPADDGAGPQALPTLMGEGPAVENEPQALPPTLAPLPTLMGESNTPEAPATATPEVVQPVATPQGPAPTFTPMIQIIEPNGPTWIDLDKGVACLSEAGLPGTFQLGYVQASTGNVQVAYYHNQAGVQLNLAKVHNAQICMNAQVAWIVARIGQGEGGWRWDYTEALKGSNPQLLDWFLTRYLSSVIRVEFYDANELPFETTLPRQ